MQLKHFPASSSAILIIDMTLHFSNEGDENYQRRFWEVARNIAALKQMALAAGSHAIYVNTCFASKAAFYESPMAGKSEPLWIRGTKDVQIVDPLQPQEGDSIIEKSVMSCFFGTALESILQQLSVRWLILTGVHTHVCILLTAADAFYRGYQVLVPEDCVTTIDLQRHEFGLRYVNRHLGQTTSTTELKNLLVPNKK